jgi:hypothetical protein
MVRSLYIPPMTVGLSWMGHPIFVHPTHDGGTVMDGAPAMEQQRWPLLPIFSWSTI